MSEPHITFRVSRMPNGAIHGQTTGCVMHPGGRQVTWISTPYGVLAKDAFPVALDLAREHGITALNIDDPHGLFPSLGFGEAQRPM